MPVSARRQDAEFALPEVESKHELEDDSIIGASATERSGPQASHQGLPIQRSKTQRQPHRRALKLIAWRPAEPFGCSATHAYESLALFAGEGVYAAGMVLSTAKPSGHSRSRPSDGMCDARAHPAAHSSSFVSWQHSEGGPPRLLDCRRSVMNGSRRATETSAYARAGTELRAPSSELSESAACAPHRSGFTGTPTAIGTAPGRRSIEFPPRMRPFASRFDLQCP